MPKHISTPKTPERFDTERLPTITPRGLTEALNVQRSRVRILSNHAHNLELALRQARAELDKDQALILMLKREKGARHEVG